MSILTQFEPAKDGNHQVSSGFKHIFLGIDGTRRSAFRDRFYSNVYRLSAALDRKDRTGRNPQIFIYACGLGTEETGFNLQASLLGRGLDRLILHTYLNLASNYVSGDKIYLFGFSRGAVAARALAGFITTVGLLRADSISHTADAWLYFNEALGGKGKIRYKNILADLPKWTHLKERIFIDFLGLWDTVSGPIGQNELQQRYRFDDLELSKCVKNAVHILSIDETRRTFQPILFTGTKRTEQHLEQIWMPGVHTDIGGGYGRQFLSTVSLIAMIDKLAETNPDLAFDDAYVDTQLSIVQQENAVVNDEFEYLSLIRRRLARTREMGRTAHDIVHPLLDFMIGKQISFKGKITEYHPRFRSATVMDLTRSTFTNDSWFNRKLINCLTERFREESRSR
jgi:uncharacterized protein (DUF2235 family)